VAVTAKDLLIATAKGRGAGPNPVALKHDAKGEPEYPYNPAMTNGSLARIPLEDLRAHLADWTALTCATNAAQGNTDRVPFAGDKNNIRHVIYIIKENRTYDQVFGDLPEANGDASLSTYGEDITPNQHKLARQFGILDNFYDSGDVSGDGHSWSLLAPSPIMSRRPGPSTIAAASTPTTPKASYSVVFLLPTIFPMPASPRVVIFGKILPRTAFPTVTTANSSSRNGVMLRLETPGLPSALPKCPVLPALAR
jgi:hypothetical protein